MSFVIALIVMVLIGVGTVSLLSTDAGQLGCNVVIMLMSALFIGAFVLLFGALFVGGCTAMFS